MAERGGIATIGCHLAGPGKRRIDVAPKPRALGRNRHQVQRCGRIGRIEVASLRVVRRCNWQRGPFHVVDLVMDQTPGIDPGKGQWLIRGEASDWNLHAGTLGNLHPEKELKLPANLVQDVVNAVSGFGDVCRPIRVGGDDVPDPGPLVRVQ